MNTNRSWTPGPTDSELWEEYYGELNSLRMQFEAFMPEI